MLGSGLATLASRPAIAADQPYPLGSFHQELAHHRELVQSLPAGAIRALDLGPDGVVRLITSAGVWRQTNGQWVELGSEVQPATPPNLPNETRQWARGADGRVVAATVTGLWQLQPDGAWQPLRIADGLGRSWATSDVRGVTFDQEGRLWFATLAGVGHESEQGWAFLTGADGLPYNDFTCCAAGRDGSVWFGTRKGVIRYANGEFAYRQGPRWLPNDDVQQLVIDAEGSAWILTAGGLGWIERRPLTFAQKAAFYEHELEQYIKRTEFGYTSEVHLARPGDRSEVTRGDSDNDGLWTAMYGAGECFAYGATQDPAARRRAEQAFAALRFLQKVTQGGPHSPPLGYVARTILSTNGPDPNSGRLESDRRTRAEGDRMWKVYEPRWPKSADGKWYWKSDTSSDELDGHYFFYPLYYDLVAQTDAERAAVREVVRDLTDHLIRHDFVLQDHDGQPTRWAVFRPSALNQDFRWSSERGLNSLSILSYLAVAAHVTGEPRYLEVARQLREHHSFHINLMVPKAQRAIGSGNQSDDEMAFMSFYNLLKYEPDEALRKHYLASFYGYWMLEQPECNPFFNFCYAPFGQGQTYQDAFDNHDLSPWEGWLEDSVATLRDFPLDRADWPHQNSHRLDLIRLPIQAGSGAIELHRGGRRGYRVNGKVLSVAERHFNHWNTDPWDLDYAGSGHTLASGTVFLLPYYMGLYHGFLRENGE